MTEATNATDRMRQTWERLPSTAVVAVLSSAVAVIRWLLAITHGTMSIYFDETAQLAVARTLAGGGEWSLYDAPTWQPGFGTLIAPLYVLSDDPELVYRLAVVVNAVLGGVAAVLLAFIGRELTRRSMVACAVVAGLISLTPGAIVASAFAWAEQLLVTIALATLLCGLVLARTGRVGLAFLLAGLANLGYLTHARLLPLVGVSVIGGGLLLVQQRRTATTIGFLAWSGAGFVLVRMYSSWIQGQVWTDARDDNTAVATLRRLEDPISVLDSAVGQLWYLLVASVGLIVFAGVWAVRGLRSGERRTEAAVLLAWALPIFAVSVVFMAGRLNRTDMLIYGRYNEAVLGPILFVGWFEFRRFARSAGALTRAAGLTAGLVLATGLVVHVLHADELREGEPFSVMVPALIALDTAPGSRTLPPTLVAVFVLAVVVAVARVAGIRSAVFRATIVLIVAAGALRVGNVTTSVGDQELTTDQLAEFSEAVPAGETVVLRVIPRDRSILYSPTKQRARLQYFQHELPEQRFDMHTDDSAPDAHYVLAPELTTELVESDATVVWDDPVTPLALWYVPSVP